MICGIGVDIALVKRFESWTKFSHNRLSKIFTDQELSDCRSGKNCLIAEKLAVRFAAKEAFYKALSATLVSLGITQKEFSLMFSCQHVSVVPGKLGVPTLSVDWKAFENKIGASLPLLKTHLSLSHEKATAVAFVVIEKI